MSIIRAAGRTLLASYFIASGIKAIRNPGPLGPAAEPLADKVVPLVKQYAPEQVSNYVPRTPRPWCGSTVRPRCSAGSRWPPVSGGGSAHCCWPARLMPSTIAKYPFWSRDDPEQRADERAHFLKNASLLGGVMLAAVDTEGKPSLA